MATESDYLGASSGLYGIDKPEFGGRRYDSPEEYFWLLAPLLMVALLLARNIVAGRIGRVLGAVNGSDVAAECLGSREPERRGVPESEDLPVYDRTWECRDRSASAQRGRPVPGRAGAAGAG